MTAKANPARTLDEVLAALPVERRERIEARAAGQIAQMDNLKSLRRLTAKSQEQIAQSLGIKQPSVLKIERQTDLYLSTLRRFIEAAGGTLELRVELPGHGVFTLNGLGDIGANGAA